MTRARIPPGCWPLARRFGRGADVLLRLRRFLLVAACTVSIASAAAAAIPIAEGALVELPPLEVGVTVGGRWRYVEVPGLEVLSRCSDSTTREFIEAEHRLGQLLRQLVPEQFQASFATPKIILLSNQRTTPTAAQEIVAGFAPRAKDGAAAEQPSGGGAPAAAKPNVRILPNLRLDDRDATTLFAIIDEDKFDGNRLSLTPSHLRMLLERRTPPLPRWLIEGVMSLFEAVKFTPDSLALGPVDWFPETAARALRADADHPRTLLPMQDMFAAPPADGSSAHGQLWRAQAALFVQWCLDGENSPRRAALWKLVTRATTGPIDEAALRECFGCGYADLRDQLSDYLPVALKTTVVLRQEKFVKMSVPRPRLATGAEIGRLKGEWERLEVGYVQARHPQYAPRYLEQARRTFTQAQQSGEREPRLLGAIGLYECDLGNVDAAVPLLEAAVQAKVVRPRVYVELARARYISAWKNPASAKLLSAAQANAILEPLAMAHQQAPPLAETYRLAAEVWARSEIKLSATQFQLLQEGLRLFPGDANLVCDVALVDLLQGRKVEAAALIDHGMKIAQDDSSRERLRRVQSVLTGQLRPESPRP